MVYGSPLFLSFFGYSKISLAKTFTAQNFAVLKLIIRCGQHIINRLNVLIVIPYFFKDKISVTMPQAFI